LLAPGLADYHAPGVELNSPSLRALPTPLLGGNSFAPGASGPIRYAVVFHRRADLPDAVGILEHGRVVNEYKIRGVWVARLIERDAPRGEKDR
jgi:hypothetical protein